MKISPQWLADFLPSVPTAERCADILSNAGLLTEEFHDVGPDRAMEVEVTSNRGDCLSHLGVARELAALTRQPLNDPDPSAPESQTPASSAAQVRIDAPDLCPHYTARVIRNVKVGPSPEWLVRRLTAVGLRPVNNVVDVTNYVLFELGQPLHAFDYDKLAGRQIVVRRANKGETLTSLDNHQRPLAPDMLVIADAEKPVALAGVMGGLHSEVSDQTTTILLESARFDPLSVRKTARALSMKSDSSYRFERGIDPLLPARASLRAAQLILQTAGGELLAGLVEAGGADHAPKTLTLRAAKIRQVLGIDVPIETVVDVLARLHFNPRPEGDAAVVVTVPSYRLDINIEVDLVEEVARTIGYDQIPLRDEISIRLTPPSPTQKGMAVIRDALVAAGYFEAVTFSWVTDALAGDFLPPDAATLPRADAAVRKADAHLRPSLLPGLLESLRRNETTGTPDARLFETGSVFHTDPAGNIVESRRLALLAPADPRDLRGAVETLLARINPDLPLAVTPAQRPGYAPGACARVDWNNAPIGHLGKIDPATAEKLSLRDLPVAAELDLDALLNNLRTTVTLNPLPKYPPVRRDLSLVLPEPTRYEQVDHLVRSLDLPDLEDLEYVTTYRGKPLDKGQKSLTITLIFRSPTGTLTSDQVESSVSRLTTAAQQKLHATLRT